MIIFILFKMCYSSVRNFRGNSATRKFLSLYRPVPYSLKNVKRAWEALISIWPSHGSSPTIFSQKMNELLEDQTCSICGLVQTK